MEAVLRGKATELKQEKRGTAMDKKQIWYLRFLVHANEHKRQHVLSFAGLEGQLFVVQ